MMAESGKQIARDTCEALLRGTTQALCFGERAFAVLPSVILLVAKWLIELMLHLDASAVCKPASQALVAYFTEICCTAFSQPPLIP